MILMEFEIIPRL